MIPLDDRGLTLGDGLFETVLARGGDLILFEAHAGRMGQGAGVIGLPAPDPEAMRRLAQAAVAAAPDPAGRLAVRISCTAGSGGRGLDRPETPVPRMWATAAPAPRPEGPARLALSDIRRNPTSPTSRLKTLSYLDSVEARRRALLAGADEALMLDSDGHLACAAAANLFWVAGGRLHTPPDAGAILAGVMRRTVITAAEGLGLSVVTPEARPEALFEAEGVFLTNSLIGVRPVSRLDGRDLSVSPVTDRLAAAVAAWT